MRILVIGSGGREDALVWKLSQSPLVSEIFVAPGNGGTASSAKNIDIDAGDIPALVKFARENNIDLVVPGPELPLVLGVCDAMGEAGIACFGPDAFCARLEGSKSFAKEIMAKAGVPTAKSLVFTDVEEALACARAWGAPLVVKADGLAAGKGVVVADTLPEAEAAIREMLADNRFGDAGSTIVLEEKLMGEEVSLLCLCDGETALPLSSAQDHKAAFDKDTGPNTGGMGAYSPAPLLPDSKLEEMTSIVIRPVLAELARQGHPFRGILYAGLMLTADGPKVLEYNVRFGDPECQPLLMRLNNDLAALMQAGASGSLAKQKLAFSPKSALGVVVAAAGYPGSYEKNLPIDGIEKAHAKSGVRVFQAGTASRDGRLFSTGGRVLCVTALGDDLAQAKRLAYEAAEKIDMPGSRYRTDIGDKGLKRLQNS